jgi:hypothetical protein
LSQPESKNPATAITSKVSVLIHTWRMPPNIVIGRQIVHGCMHGWFGQGQMVAWD